MSNFITVLSYLDVSFSWQYGKAVETKRLSLKFNSELQTENMGRVLNFGIHLPNLEEFCVINFTNIQ